MKRILMAFLLMPFITFADGITDQYSQLVTMDGINLTYRRTDGKTAIEMARGAEIIALPSTLGGCPVVKIGGSAFRDQTYITAIIIPEGIETIDQYAFSYCSSLKNLLMPSSVTAIGYRLFECCFALETVSIPAGIFADGQEVFYGCRSLTQLTIPSDKPLSTWFLDCNGEQYSTRYEQITNVIVSTGCKKVCDNCFDGCFGLETVTIPSSVMRIGNKAFQDCHNLKRVVFLGNAPDLGADAFSGTPQDLKIVVPDGSIGWGKRGTTELPANWGCRLLETVSGKTGRSDEGSPTVVVSNVVVHYVVNSMQPQKLIPASMDYGFVNIITEVTSSGAVSVPATWMMNFPNYVPKFGSDFVKSLMKPTGKKDGSGNAMLVWQDYVAGTDPTDEKDVFTASITMDATGKLIISYSPELSDDEKTKRIYKTLGKVKLTDSDWVEVPTGHEADYNFFKVTVQMK